MEVYRTIWIAVAMLMFTTIAVSGANLSVTPNVEYDDPARFGVVNEMSVVLIPSGYVPVVETYDGNESLFELGQYDEIVYSYPSTSQIVSPSGVQRLLSNGQRLTLSEAGTYNAVRISDNTSWSVESAPFVTPVVDWSIELPAGFFPRQQSGSVTLDEEREVLVSYEIENFTDAGDYDLNVVLDGLSFNVTRSVNVRDVTTFSSSLSGMNATAVTGASGQYALLELSSSGNKPDEAVASISGNISQYLSVRSSVAVYPDLTLDYPVVYNIPLDARKGLYTGRLTVNLDGFVEHHNLTLEVRDSSPPNVSLRIPSPLVEGVRSNASVLITDSESFDYNVTVAGQAVVLEDRGGGFYRFFFTPKQGMVIWACATDDSGNEECVFEQVETTVEDWFRENTAERIDTGRTGGERVHYLGQREYDGTYRFSYELVESTSPVSFWLGDGESQVRWMENDTLNQTGSGLTNLHVRMESDGEYTLIVYVDNPDSSEGDDEIRLTGRFRQYQIPDSFELELPGLVEPGTCNPVEGAGFEDSFLTCELRYRLDYDISEISVPVTPSQLEEIENQADAQIAEYEDREGVFMLIILLLTGAVGASLAILWVAGQSRYVRRRG